MRARYRRFLPSLGSAANRSRKSGSRSANSLKTCIKTSRAFRARRRWPYSSYPVDFAASVVGSGWATRLGFFRTGAEIASLTEEGYLRRKVATASGSGLTPQRSSTLFDSSSISSSSSDSISFAHASGRVL